MIDDIRIEPMNETHLKDLALLEKQCFSVPWSENAFRSEHSTEKSLQKPPERQQLPERYTFFSSAPRSLRAVAAAMKLDVCFLEEKL